MELLSILDILRAPLDGYHWLVEKSITLARDLFKEYGYLVVFLGTCLENTLFLGLFIPGIFVILLAGISAYEGLISFPIAMAVGVAGTSLGDTVSYFAGRYGWKRAIEHTERVPWMSTMRRILVHRTALFVLAYHFMGYTRLVGPITAGAMRVPFARWWIYDFLGAVLWVGVYMSLGMLLARLGFTLDESDSAVRRLEWLFIALAVVGVAVYLYTRNRAPKEPAILEVLDDEK
jgi:membrane protein DedA with SNARE-associated domain